MPKEKVETEAKIKETKKLIDGIDLDAVWGGHKKGLTDERLQEICHVLEPIDYVLLLVETMLDDTSEI